MSILWGKAQTDPKNWIDFHRDFPILPGETEGRVYGYGADGYKLKHAQMVEEGSFKNRNFFGKTVPMNRAAYEFMFAGDLRLVFDYPGYPNSHIGLISMNDTDAQKTERYTLVMFNIGAGGPEMTKINPNAGNDGTDKLRIVNLVRSAGIFEVTSLDELLQVIKNSFDASGYPPHISRMAGGEGNTLICNDSAIPFTGVFLVFPSVDKPILTP